MLSLTQPDTTEDKTQTNSTEKNMETIEHNKENSTNDNDNKSIENEFLPDPNDNQCPGPEEQETLEIGSTENRATPEKSKKRLFIPSDEI